MAESSLDYGVDGGGGAVPEFASARFARR